MRKNHGQPRLPLPLLWCVVLTGGGSPQETPGAQERVGSSSSGPIAATLVA